MLLLYNATTRKIPTNELKYEISCSWLYYKRRYLAPTARTHTRARTNTHIVRSSERARWRKGQNYNSYRLHEGVRPCKVKTTAILYITECIGESVCVYLCGVNPYI